MVWGELISHLQCLFAHWEMLSMIDDVFAKFFDVFSLDVLFLRSLARSKIFEKTACVAAIDLVRKSSKSEPSSQFFGRLKFCPVSDFSGKFDFWGVFCCFGDVLIRSMISMIIMLIMLILLSIYQSVLDV